MPARTRSTEGLVVALDGPGSSGKSSVGAAAARELDYRFFDTGLLYRAITWLALDRKVGSHDEAALVDLVDELELADDDAGHLNRVLSDGRDVTDAVRGPEVDAYVSEISAVAPLRAALLERQRALAADGRIIMAGRDIGTVVLPDADLKIYLDASVEERAARRTRERNLDPSGPEADRVLTALRERDRLDTGRAVAPLRAAADARILTTDGNEFEDTVAMVVGAIRDAEARAADEAREAAAAQ
jgi:cytidylate kinase